MISTFTIKNYKSIVDIKLELGRFNIFIGENGAGKTNILEALAMAAGAASNRLANEDLIARGVRVARSQMTISAFHGDLIDNKIEIDLIDEKKDIFKCRLKYEEGKWIWHKNAEIKQHLEKQTESLRILFDNYPDMEKIYSAMMFHDLEKHFDKYYRFLAGDIANHINNYGIYCAETLVLRGLQIESHREPLGLYGEALDVTVAQLAPELRQKIIENAQVISWFESLDVDREGRRKLEGYKPGRSHSDLYFVDRFLSEENKLFSAENANEGILHLLFYLVLFMAPDTPRLFAIDNIETALNPYLLRNLIKTLAQLAKEHDRQALVTTHNPAALDGLNLHDDDQRLFVVYRSDEGHTKVRRVMVKPESPEGGPKLKLSEMWMRGMLGGIPTHF